MQSKGSLTASVTAGVQAMMLAMEKVEGKRFLLRAVDWTAEKASGPQRKIGIAIHYSRPETNRAGVATALVRLESRPVEGSEHRNWVPTHIRLAFNGYFDLRFVDGFSLGIVTDHSPEKTWSDDEFSTISINED